MDVWHLDRLLQSEVGIPTVTLVCECMAFSSSTGVRGWDSYSDNSAWVCGILIVYCSPRLGSYSNIGAWVCGILSAARGRDPYSDPVFFCVGVWHFYRLLELGSIK